MATPERPNIPLSLALRGLQEACRAVDDLDVEYAQKRREKVADRNEAIVDAVEMGYPISKLARICGISRTRIYQLMNNEDSTKQ